MMRSIGMDVHRSFTQVAIHDGGFRSLRRDLVLRGCAALGPRPRRLGAVGGDDLFDRDDLCSAQDRTALERDADPRIVPGDRADRRAAGDRRRVWDHMYSFLLSKECAGSCDNYGYALSAQTGWSWGRPDNNTSSQLIVYSACPLLRTPTPRSR